MDNSIFNKVSDKDKQILRTLGEQVAIIGSNKVMEEKRHLWKKLNALQAERPMILVETCSVVDELMPLKVLECEGEWARSCERDLRLKLYHYENIDDDMVIEPRIRYGCVIDSSDYGFKVERHKGDNGQGKGSYTWDAPITDIEEGLKKLHFRSHKIDTAATELQKALLEEVFEGVLPVVNRGWYWWTQGLSIDAIDLIGLEGLMLAMYDQPEQLHRLMAFLRDDKLNTLDWFEKQGILFPNNEDDYIGSGGCGYTNLLPQKDYIPGKPGRIKDMWGLSESQETVGVSPEMFEEFVFTYQLPIISKFGFACYGCCEPLDKRWHIVKRIPNLRRVSVSPWADQEKMAEYLGKNYVYSRKPSPTDISMSYWDEDILRNDLKKTLQITRGLNVELVMKDVHTLSNQPWRLGRWAQIVRETMGTVLG